MREIKRGKKNFRKLNIYLINNCGKKIEDEKYPENSGRENTTYQVNDLRLKWCWEKLIEKCSHILTNNDQPPKCLYCLTFYIQLQWLEKLFRAEFLTLPKLLIDFMSFNYYVTSVGLQFEMVQGDFSTSSVGKESTCNSGDPGSIPGSGRSTGEERGYSLQYC